MPTQAVVTLTNLSPMANAIVQCLVHLDPIAQHLLSEAPIRKDSGISSAFDKLGQLIWNTTSADDGSIG